jgi:ferritin-like metal-binding protein YciE
MNMKLVVEKLPDLSAVYIRQLRIQLSAEEVTAIKTPFLRESATDSELIQFFQQSIQANESHADTLRKMLQPSTDGSGPLKCRVAYALFDEAEDLVEAAGHPSVRDAVMVAAAQRIKHFQIANYGALRQFALDLGHEQEIQIFEDILRVEGHLTRQLSGIASRVNPMAVKTDQQPQIHNFPGGPVNTSEVHVKKLIN